MSLYQEILDAGIDFSHHFSDLYIPVTPETQNLLAKYPQAQKNTTTFINQSPEFSGQLWFDVSFEYDPYWHSSHSHNTT